MSMPGLTAELSLYRTREHYRMAARRPGGLPVLPQLIIIQPSFEECYYNCRWLLGGDRTTCYYNCLPPIYV
jgi:hypothetical protein